MSAVTVYELALKTIFLEFAHAKHKLLGNFTNGRIKLAVIKDDYIPKFGDKYLKRFNKKLEARERQILTAERASVKSSLI